MTTQTRHRNERPPGVNRVTVAEHMAGGPNNDPTLAGGTDTPPEFALVHVVNRLLIATLDDLHAAFESGREHERGIVAAEQADQAAHRRVADLVHAMATLDEWPVAQQKRRHRQQAVATRARKAAVPWPGEAAG